MILDTNALAAFLKEDRSVLRHVDDAEAFCLPVIVLGEYRYGLAGSKARAALTVRLDALVADATVLVIDDLTTRVYAAVRAELKVAGTPIPENDVWIAALVRQHNMPLLTRDGHFDHVARIERICW